MQKLFLDTNVVIDFLGERMPFYTAVAKVLTLADQKKIKILISPSSISTTYYLLSKYENNVSALDKMRKFKLLCDMSVMNDDVIEKALHSNFKDFEDAIQYYSAIESKCDVIITRNERDFKEALIPVMNAENYLNTLRLEGKI